MRYFSLFSGVGGFEIGITNAYGNTLPVRDEEAKEGDGEPDAPVTCLEGTESRPLPVRGTSGSGGERGEWEILCAGFSEIDKNNAYVDARGHADERGTDVEPMPDAPVGGAHAEDPACIGFSEIDPHASAVLRYRFPNVTNYGDIAKIDWPSVPDFDLLVGGSPCQSFSVAGKRAGFSGASGLYFEYLRALREKKPAHFVWENVKGVLSSNGGRDFAHILDTMAEAGYSLWWQVLNARDFGVPQNRERVFVVGTRSDVGSPREVFFEAGAGGKGAGEIPAKTLRAHAGGFSEYDSYVRCPLRFLSRNQKNVDGDYAFTIDAGQTAGVQDGTRVRRLIPVECERLMSWPDAWTRFGTRPDGTTYPMSDTQRYKMCGNGVVSKVVEAVVRAHFLSVDKSP